MGAKVSGIMKKTREDAAELRSASQVGGVYGKEDYGKSGGEASLGRGKTY
jgi:hypothetical protein